MSRSKEGCEERGVLMRSRLRSRLIKLEENTNTLAMMDSSDCLSKNTGDIQDLQLVASSQMLVLWDTVGYHNLVDSAGIDTLNGVTAQDGMSNYSVNLSSATSFLYQFGSSSDGISSINEIINDDSNLVL